MGRSKSRIEYLKRMAAIFCAVVTLSFSLGALTPVTASELISVSAGPEGGWRISTPTQDLIVIPYGDGEFWVGTEREYSIGVVKAWAASHGLRQSHIQGYEDATAVFVPSTTLIAYLPDVRVDNVVTKIYFGTKGLAPTKRDVIIYWNQNNTTPVTLLLLDTRTKTAITPNSWWIDQGYTNAEFAVPFSALKDRTLAIFFSGVGKAAAVGMRSIAWADYSIEKQVDDGLIADGSVLSTDQRKSLEYLSQTDPSIAGQATHTRKTSKPTPNAVNKPISTPSPVATTPPVPSSLVFEECTFDRAEANGTFLEVYATLQPLEDTDVSAADFEITLEDIAGDHSIVERGISRSSGIHMRSRETQTVKIEFPLPAGYLPNVLSGL